MYQAPRRTGYRTAPPTKKTLYSMKRTGLVVTVAALLTAALLVVFFLLRHKDAAAPGKKTAASQAGTAQTGQPAPQPGGAPGFNRNKYATNDAASLWMVVNKKHQLNPKDYTPADLVVPKIPLRSNITSTEKYVRSDMAGPLESLIAAAANNGVHLNLQSGYRSYSFQVSLYNGYVKQQGQAAADRQSARPGYSEHQTGLAADLGGTSKPACNVAQCFVATPEGTWLAANAYTYGFIIRYTADKESITGYEYEPWHIRYVGTDLAAEMHATGISTLEEFFGVAGGQSY